MKVPRLISITTLLVCMNIYASASGNNPTHTNSDSTKKPPPNWFNLDKNSDNVFGISTERTYRELLKGKKSKTVVVAVIDSGVDVEHEDLQGKIWSNEDEIPGNNQDDDSNGYVDDVNGWNFIGGKDGKNVNHDTYELTREYVRLKAKYENSEGTHVRDKKEYDYYEELKKKFEKKNEEAQKKAQLYQVFLDKYYSALRLIKAYEDKEKITIEDILAIESPDEKITQAKETLAYVIGEDLEEAVQDALEYYKNEIEYGYSLTFNPRNTVGDDYGNLDEKYYGNNDVKGPDCEHGTHVAGIIAANRSNEIGMKGVADNVKIMSIRTVPNGDERDKDVANAIYYAVDNGAKVINMSFGKGYSPQKEVVDKAVRYAQSKGVLLVHAAGNDNMNIDKTANFPNNRHTKGKKRAANWVEVGALSWKKGEKLVAPFSNYGKKSVDLFSPGVDIYSTTPENNYESLSGTSMAAPVVAGAAALIMSYFPELKVSEVRNIMIKTTFKIADQQVVRPGDEGEENSEELVKFGELCKTGGIINLYEAIKMAEKISLKSKKR